MVLELVPIEGERVLTKEEKERLKRRTRAVPPRLIESFADAEQREIKSFLVELILTIEELHHCHEHEADDFAYYEKRIETWEARRNALFVNPSAALARFINLLELCPREPWREIERLLLELRRADLARHYKTKMQTGIEAALDNPFLMQQEDNLEEERIEKSMGCRITPKEVEDLVFRRTLTDLVNDLILARRAIAGDFWDDGRYDL